MNLLNYLKIRTNQPCLFGCIHCREELKYFFESDIVCIG